MDAPLVIPDSLYAGRVNGWIDDYLDHACRPLVGVVPWERRQELRQELRTHLEALMDAETELGSCAADSAAGALRRFGDPDRLGLEWLREWEQATGRSSRLLPAYGTALGTFSAATLLFWNVQLATHWPFQVSFMFLPPRELAAAITVLGVVFPVLAGVLTGLQQPGRRVLGTLLAVATLITLQVTGLEVWTALIKTFPSCYWDGVGIACWQFAFWIPSALLGTEIGRRLRDRLVLPAERWKAA